jgi:ribosome-binding protein aMBF1 (putative translation factor)
MSESSEVDQLYAAKAAAQGEFVAVPKNKTAKVKTKAGYEYSYKYADLADILKMALPILAKNGLALSQPLLVDSNGNLRITTRLGHKSGQWEQSDGLPINGDLPPQELGSELSYFRRYDLGALLAIAPDEDTDAQGTGSKVEKKNPPAPISTPKVDQTPAQPKDEPRPHEEPKQENVRKPDNSKPEAAAESLKPTPEQVRAFGSRITKAGADKDLSKAWMTAHFGVRILKDLSIEQWEAGVAKIESAAAESPEALKTLLIGKESQPNG